MCTNSNNSNKLIMIIITVLQGVQRACALYCLCRMQACIAYITIPYIIWYVPMQVRHRAHACDIFGNCKDSNNVFHGERRMHDTLQGASHGKKAKGSYRAH